MCSSVSRLTANAFVQKSTVVTSTSTGQKSPELLLCIFLTLLAVDAIAGVGERVESLVRDLIAALVATTKGFGCAIQPAQGFIDVPEETTFLAREEERLLALHRVGALIRHMERVTAQVAVGFLGSSAERLVGAAKLLHHALALVEQTLLEM